MNELSALLEAFANIPPDTARPIEYRLYYNDSGIPVTMTSDSVDLPGNYILISKEVYDRADYRARVIDGKLIEADDPTIHYQGLGKGFQFRTAKGHAGILVDETYQGETETYGFKNH